jgi:hypothetical protein
MPARGIKTDLTPEHLALVAAIYSRALSQGLAPAPAVAEHFSRPVTTVHRWIARARAHGLLSPTRQGLASGDEGVAPILAAELGIPEADLLTAMRKHRIGLRIRQPLT